MEGRLLLLLSLLLSGGAAFPEHGPKAEPEPEPEPEPQPVAAVHEPAKEHEHEPYAEPTPEPTPEATPEPTPEPYGSVEGRSLGSELDAVVIGSPTNAAECRKAGGECIPTEECPNAKYGWNQPFKGICGRKGYDCCFKDMSQHTMECGVFGGDCAAAKSCGAAPRHSLARCARTGDVCCIWLT